MPRNDTNCVERDIGRQSRSRRLRLLMALGILVTGIAAAWLGFKLGPRDDAGQSPTQISRNALPVEAVPIEQANGYYVEHLFTGRIVAGRQSGLGFVRTGTVVEVLVDEGARVYAGQVIARLLIKRSELLAKLDQARATLDEVVAGPREEQIAAAEADIAFFVAQVDLARFPLGRIENTFEQKAMQAQLSAAHHRLRELRNGSRPETIRLHAASVVGTEAAIAAVDLDLARSDLRAPYSGTISRRFVDEGSVVQWGKPIVRVLEDRRETRVGVPVHIAASLAVGSMLPVEIDGVSYPMRVSAVLPDANLQTSTVIVILKPDNPLARVAGELVRLRHEEFVPSLGHWLPLAALMVGPRGLWTIYSVEPAAANESALGPATVARQLVEVLHAQGDWVFVRGTLTVGDLIIASGVHRVVQGQPVRVVKTVRALKHGRTV